jgi:hypothetical protein
MIDSLAPADATDLRLCMRHSVAGLTSDEYVLDE